MTKTFKTISFTLLILSLGLVLSACNKEDARIKEQENIKAQLQEQEGQEVISDEEINEENGSDLDISRWREYENEHFNLKFKYHQNWYFQRDTLHQGTYVAVYGFAPSAEELQERKYAINLYILNEGDFLERDYSLRKEKQVKSKRYILTSNNEEYADIFNMMFENLDFFNEETSEEVEEEVSLNTYTNEEYGFEFQYPENIYLKEVNDGYLLLRYSSANKTDWLISISKGDPSHFMNRDEELSFDDALEREIKNRCAADGPGGSIFCSEVLSKSILKKDNYNLYEYFLLEEYQDTQGITSKTNEKGPIFVFHKSGSTEIYIFQLTQYEEENNYEKNVIVLENLIDTFKFTN
jgi:hypothetical protein